MASIPFELQAARSCDLQAAYCHAAGGQATVRHMQALVCCDVGLFLGLCSGLATHIVCAALQRASESTPHDVCVTARAECSF